MLPFTAAGSESGSSYEPSPSLSAPTKAISTTIVCLSVSSYKSSRISKVKSSAIAVFPAVIVKVSFINV